MLEEIEKLESLLKSSKSEGKTIIAKDAVSNFSAQIKIHIENSIKVRSNSIVSTMI